MAELKECPFCGGKAEILHYETDGYLPHCGSCDGMVEKWFAFEQEAVAAWNRRTEPEPRALTLDELRERTRPVYVPLDNTEGYWCLCINGYITPPSLLEFNAEDRPNWIFFDREPGKGAEHGNQ